MRHVENIRGLRSAVEKDKKRLASMRRSLHDFVEGTGTILEGAGRAEVEDEAIAEVVRGLVNDLNAARQARDQSASLQASLEEQDATIKTAAEAANKIDAQAEALLSQASAADDDGFVRLCGLREQRDSLRGAVGELEGKIEVRSGPGEARRRFETELETLGESAALQQARDQAAEKLEACEEQLRETIHEQGESTNQIQELEQGDRISQLLREKEAALAELDHLGREWARWRLTSYLLNRTRQEFEDEHQAPVLEAASLYLRQITGEEYVAIRRPLDTGEFVAVRHDGQEKTAPQWNRGLREQLYLAVRFGFIEHYCRDNEPLPIILDETLANCDPQHTRRTAEVLCDLAKQRQVLYLTCHPHAVELFTDINPQAPHYRLTEQRFELVPPARRPKS